jgi:hypothetical protein
MVRPPPPPPLKDLSWLDVLSLEQLVKLAEGLQNRINAKREEAKEELRAEIKEKARLLGLDPAELIGRSYRPRMNRSEVKPKSSILLQRYIIGAARLVPLPRRGGQWISSQFNGKPWSLHVARPRVFFLRAQPSRCIRQGKGAASGGRDHGARATALLINCPGREEARLVGWPLRTRRFVYGSRRVGGSARSHYAGLALAPTRGLAEV